MIPAARGLSGSEPVCEGLADAFRLSDGDTDPDNDVTERRSVLASAARGRIQRLETGGIAGGSHVDAHDEATGHQPFAFGGRTAPVPERGELAKPMPDVDGGVAVHGGSGGRMDVQARR